MYELIKTRFSKAIQHYDNNAIAQSIIAKKLFSIIGESPAADNILEIGCGTGNLSRMLLNMHPKALILNDICQDYVVILSQKLKREINNDNCIQFWGGNAQDIIKKDIVEKFNLIASSSSIQWIQNPLEFLIDCKKIMTPNALIAISTFAPNNLYQIASIEGSCLKYNTLEEIRNTLQIHYDILHLSTDDITLTFNTPLDVLKHMKLTGVNGIDSKTWTKKHLLNFTEQYNNKFTNSEGLCTLTYKPIFILCKNSKL